LSYTAHIPEKFCVTTLRQHNYFNDLVSLFELQQGQQWPDYLWFNRLPFRDYRFIDQQEFEGSGLYYEEIIFQRKQIPTRSKNWHDFFNALIWQLFPQTKVLLNQLHIQQIQEFGLKPRTAVRDRITHFDECGMVLAVTRSKVPELLAEHEWQQAFVAHKQEWGTCVQPFVFGHANYEMLLNPYIGLTGKWLALEVEDSFWQQPKATQYQLLDKQLCQYIQQLQFFQQKRRLKPLPLLGIPGWWRENEQQSFYANQEYFRPKPLLKS